MSEITKTNIEVLYEVLGDILSCGADEDGYPEVDYETLVCATPYIACPYIHQPKCAEFAKFHREYGGKVNPDAYADCDECKAHWLFEKWEG